MKHSVPRRWESLTFSAFSFVYQVLIESQRARRVHNPRGTPQTHYEALTYFQVPIRYDG